MNIDEAVKIACEEPTLLDALVWICVWESGRVVEQVKENLCGPNGQGGDSCFKFCLEQVIKKYNQTIDLTANGRGR